MPCRYIAILGTNNRTDLLDSKPISLQGGGIAVNLYLTFYGTRGRNTPYTINTPKHVQYLILQDLVQPRSTLPSCGHQNLYGNIVYSELKEHRIVRSIGQSFAQKTEFVANVVGGTLHVRTLIKLNGYHRNILTTFTRNMLLIGNTVEDIFDRFGNVCLHILRPCSGVGGQDNNVVGLDLRVEVDRQLLQREYT